MQMKLDRRFYRQARGVFEKYEFDVGIIKDGPHYTARRGAPGLKGQDVLKTYAGGPARKQSRVPSGKTISQVSAELRKTTRVNFYVKPFRARKNADILRFSKAFFALCAGRGEKRRVENYLQAIVRNPILRGDYGTNSALTTKIKGFNRYMIDTAQFFKAIRAKVRRRSSVPR